MYPPIGIGTSTSRLQMDGHNKQATGEFENIEIFEIAFDDAKI
jgi:hypothetical protein